MKNVSVAIKVFNRSMGSGKPMFIVAEMGQNHNGSLQLAKKILEAAKKAGVDAVKLQTLTAEKLVSKKTSTYGTLDPNLPKKQWLMYKQAELSRENHRKLFVYAKEIGLSIFSTPFDEENADFLESLGMSLFKVASGDLTHHALLKHIACKKKPMIISTGMATLKEVKEAVKVVENAGNNKIILLHCTSSYPCKPQHVNLNAVRVLMREFPYPVGLSDHTLDDMAAVALAAMGGSVLEKHFTCDKKIKGIDHWLSLDGKEMQALIAKVRATETMLGEEKKAPNQSEKEAMKLARRSVISTQDIYPGMQITQDMISIRRPGVGILPKDVDKVVGRVAKVVIRAETPVQWKMLK